MKNSIFFILLFSLSNVSFSQKKMETDSIQRLLDLSGSYFEQGNYLQSLNYDLKALTLAEQTGDTALISRCYNKIGSVFLVQKDYSRAGDYFKKVLTLSEKTRDKNVMAEALNNLGNVHEAAGNHTSALPNYAKSLKLYEELRSKAGIAICSSNLGIVYSELGNDTLAASYHFKALALDEEIKSPSGIACDALHIGEFYMSSKKYKEAERYLLRSLAISDTLNNLSGQKDASEKLSRLYSTTGQHQTALDFYQRAAQANDSLLNEEKNKELTRLEMSYEFEKKETIAKTVQEKKDLMAAAGLRRNKLIAAGLILLLIVIITAILYARKKDKLLFETEKQLLTLEQQRLNEELKHAEKMLESYTKTMIQKSELLEKFENEIETLRNLKSKELYDEKITQLDYLNKITILTEEDWQKFQELFEQVYIGFFVRLKEKLPGLTPAETRLMCLTKLQFTGKQMADALGVSLDTIKKTRYRLRKKLADPETEDIEDLLKNI